MNYMYKELLASGFRVEIINGEIKLIHRSLGEAKFIDWSSEAYKQLREFTQRVMNSGEKHGATAEADAGT